MNNKQFSVCRYAFCSLHWILLMLKPSTPIILPPESNYCGDYRLSPPFTCSFHLVLVADPVCCIKLLTVALFCRATKPAPETRQFLHDLIMPPCTFSCSYLQLCGLIYSKLRRPSFLGWLVLKRPLACNSLIYISLTWHSPLLHPDPPITPLESMSCRPKRNSLLSNMSIS